MELYVIVRRNGFASAGDLEAAFTWSGYAASKAPVFGVFAMMGGR